MSTKSEKQSPRLNTKPFTYHFKEDAKKILSAFCTVNTDTDVGAILNELAIEHILKSKNVVFKTDNSGKKTEATVTGDKGTITIKLSHNLE